MASLSKSCVLLLYGISINGVAFTSEMFAKPWTTVDISCEFLQLPAIFKSRKDSNWNSNTVPWGPIEIRIRGLQIILKAVRYLVCRWDSVYSLFGCKAGTNRGYTGCLEGPSLLRSLWAVWSTSGRRFPHLRFCCCLFLYWNRCLTTGSIKSDSAVTCCRTLVIRGT